MAPILNESGIDLSQYEPEADVISGLNVDANRFVSVMQFARLQRLVENPLMAIDPSYRAMSQKADAYFDLHEAIQREFDKRKKANAEAYANYIVKIHAGENGDTPAIDLYTPEDLTVFVGKGDQKAKLLWPHSMTAVPYDGETQLAARTLAAKINADTAKMPVIVTITHGKPIEFAKQCFHDRNAFQQRASTGVAMAMDTRDIMINVVRVVEERVKLAKGAIVWKSRQMPKKGSQFIAAASFVRTAVICLAHGISGVQVQTASAPPGLTEEEFTVRAVLWFGKVIDKCGGFMKDRDSFVASSPAVWAALGAMGHQLLNPEIKDEATLNTIAEGLVSKLNDIDWRKGDHWVGIAVKSTATGYSFAGGAKDTGSIAFKALDDKADTNYARIRHLPAQAEAA